MDGETDTPRQRDLLDAETRSGGSPSAGKTVVAKGESGNVRRYDEGRLTFHYSNWGSDPKDPAKIVVTDEGRSEVEEGEEAEDRGGKGKEKHEDELPEKKSRSKKKKQEDEERGRKEEKDEKHVETVDIAG
ncbi:unnamed protein product, partial [Timema podura]|nr:unnamed protein product [Timema podura]